MKKIILSLVILSWFISVKGQISLTADSMIISKSDVIMDKFHPISKVAESLSMEIDKDLLTLRVFGKAHEHAVIENAYILELLEVDNDQEKWLFQGVDKNCISYTITLNTVNKRIDFLTFRKEPNDNKTLIMIYYTIVDIKINKEAIVKHLEEKANSSTLNTNR